MIYITGITGHSGKWLLKRLETEGYTGKIRCVMRKSQEEDPAKYEIFHSCSLDLEYAVGDITDKNFLIESLQGVSTIIHTAGIDKSRLLVDTAISAGVDWAILVHTTGRFSKFKSASAEYIEIEDALIDKRGKIAVTVLRPTMIYGSSEDCNMYRLITYLARHRIFPLFGDGSNLMQPVAANDLGNSYYEVLIRPDITRNKEYDLSGKEPITYLEIIQCIKKLLKSRVVILPIPFRLSLFCAKLYNAVFRSRAIISVEQVLRMKEDKAFSHDAAAMDFGYNPLSFLEGIQPEVEEYLSGVRADFSNVKYQ